MKKIIIVISILVCSNVGISQKRNDLIDYNNVNLDLLNSLVIEKAAHVRDSLNKSKAFVAASIIGVKNFLTTSPPLI
jgi:hypothetical protein